MIEWLTDNAIWLGALAAIAAIVALFLPLLSRKRSVRESPSVTTVTAKGGSVAIGGDSINSNTTISSTSTNGVVGSSDNDSVTNQDSVTRVLLVFANPSDTDPLRVQEENRALRESIQLSAQRSHFQFETLPAATIDDLRRALLKDTYDIVHFSGHGTNNGLVFEDAMGKEMVPSSEALAQLLIRNQVGTAIFNACHSLSVGSFASVGLNYTIATTDEVMDPAAIEFSRGFYDAIGAGKGVEDAYQEGISSAQLKGYSPKIILLRRGEVYSPTADTV